MVNTRGGTDKSQNWLTFLRTHSLGGPAATLNDRPKSASREVFRVDRVKVHQKCTGFALDWAKNVSATLGASSQAYTHLFGTGLGHLRSPIFCAYSELLMVVPLRPVRPFRLPARRRFWRPI